MTADKNYLAQFLGVIVGMFLLLCAPFELRAEDLSVIKAIEAGDTKLLKGALSRGANLEATYPTYYGSSALVFAINRGKIESVKILLEAGADPNHRAPTLPLDLALQRSSVSLVTLLLNHGADVSLIDRRLLVPDSELAELIDKQ